MHRFFVPQNQIPDITGSDVHHIKNVLRMKVGEQIELFDGVGKSYIAEINKTQTDKITCKILSTHCRKPEAKINTTVAQCLPKSKKMKFIIQKCTELGVTRIIPTLSERSIAKGEKNTSWESTAKEAAQQCGRASIPQISALHTFKDVLACIKSYDLALIPWELEKEKTLKAILAKSNPKNLIVLIGPEGGFSHGEVELAKASGFIPISLGNRILRTETASLAILSMLNYEYNQ